MEDRKLRPTHGYPAASQKAARTITLNLRLSPVRFLRSIGQVIFRAVLKAWRASWRAFDKLEKAVLLRLPKPLARRLFRLRPRRRKHPLLTRLGWGFMALVLGNIIVMDTYMAMRQDATTYVLSPAAQQLLPEPNPQYVAKLRYDSKTATYEYNKGYQASGAGALNSGPRFVASMAADLQTGGASFTDPTSSISVKLTPQFGSRRGEQNDGRLVYPLVGRDAQKVYTFGATGVKEDIIVNSVKGDTLEFAYKLDVPNGIEARLLPNGGVGIYGVNSSLLGNITTGSDKDAQLLEKARTNGAKTNLLFTLPAPYVKESGSNGASQTVQTRFGYKDGILTVYASGLSRARYPLSIDPTIYITTSGNLMQGNNDSNVEFDATIGDGIIKKGKTTGARINAWSQSLALPLQGLWDQGTVAANGYVYSIGGATQGSAAKQVYDEVKLSGVSQVQNFTVPTGVSSITVKMWGAGGGGGAGGGAATSQSTSGGNGGGAGYATGTVSVTAGEVLYIDVGSSGAAGGTTHNAGNGGGYSALRRSDGTKLIVAAGGGGGGGAYGTTVNGGAGGSGGTTGNAGAKATTGGGGGGGATGAAAGNGGTAGTNGTAGSVGAQYGGGNGGGYSLTSCATAVTNTQGGNGGIGAGGGGGRYNSTTTTECMGGGGGGGGYYGGGGGGSTGSNSTNRSGGGGGGGSSYAAGTGVIGGSTSANNGVSQTPGNNADADRGTAGQGGSGANVSGNNTSGNAGRVVISYTLSGGSAYTTKVYWAQFNPSTDVVQSPTPGSDGVACTSWCNKTAYDLPSSTNGGLRGMSVVAYNGFIFVIGGVDGAGARSNKVYVAKLGANGEPQLWHPTDSNKANWVYWYQSAVTLPDSISYGAAAAYNNSIYLFGGQTTTSTAGDNRVWRADILPTGDTGSWTTTGMSVLPSARSYHGVQAYNDTLYLVAGRNSSGTFLSDAYYARINSDGTMGAWTATSAPTGSGRATWGGNFTAIWGGYLYMGGGCTAVTGAYCSTIATDTQLASINSDGSLAPWGTIGNITHQRIGATMLTWQGALYRFGGCAAQNTSTGVCDNLFNNVEYGPINPDGDASTVRNSSVSGTGTCTGGTPYNCNLPTSGTDTGGHGYTSGQMSSMVVINNGYIYNIGGCRTLTSGTCTAMSDETSYAVLNSDGTMGKPSTCSTTYGGYADSNSIWCVVNTTRVLPVGIAAAGATVFNGMIYVIGGTSGGGTWLSNVYRTSIASDGSIGAWSSQTFNAVGMGSGGTDASTNAARGYLYTFTRSNPASAGTTPGFLYMLGGCTGTSGISCTNSTYFTEVIKCNIDISGTLNGCGTENQLQIDADGSGVSGTPGLGLMSGTVYANRLYLIGGACQTNGAASDPCGSTYSGNRQDTIYARLDSNNDIVVNDASVTTWKLTTGKMNPVRRRAVSFGYNGFIYSLAGYSGTSSLQDLLFSKIDVSTGDLPNSFSSSGVVVTPRWDLKAIVSNGYVYAIGGCGTGAAPANCGSLQPQVQTFQLYNNDSGAAASYSNAANPGTTAAQRVGTSSVILNGYIYNAGGCSDMACTTFTNANKVYYAPIDSYGTVGTWREATYNSYGTNLPASLAWGKLVTAGGSLYYVGGQTGAANTTAVSTVYYANTFSNGAPVTWTSTTGIGDTSSQGAQPTTQAGVAVWNGRIYVVGGYYYNGTTASVQSTVYISPDLSAGGAIAADGWKTGTSITVARAGLALITYANNLYVFGGVDASGNYLLDTQFASIGYKTGTLCQGNAAGNCTTAGTTITGTGTNWIGASGGSADMTGYKLQYDDGTTATIQSVTDATHLVVNVSRALAAGETYFILDGSVGAWTGSTALPGPLRDADGFAANGYIYLIGGRSGATTCTPNTLVTPVSANTTISSGNNPTGMGEWYETNQRYTGDRYGSGVAYANGRAYVMGGGCSSLVASAVAGDPWLQVTAIKSQPQIAKYSRMIDTDRDVFASMWLANGVDNSTGAQWSLKYRSMNDPKITDSQYQCGGSGMTTWGQETNFGPIQLSKPGVYTPKNGAGTSIGCSRFYYLALSIDSSQAFGYPEDNTRGPYVSDISLYYSSGGAGRLLHGKTFTGGLQQPLDTPCRQSNNSSDPNYAACPLP